MTQPDLVITPEPTPEETAALAAALLSWLEGASANEPPTPASEPAWRVTARREAALGIRGGVAAGWGRPRAGWRE
ncbi:MAG: hypothetical protein ACR2J8_04470 [Thermomicrobiales bacterium]